MKTLAMTMVMAMMTVINANAGNTWRNTTTTTAPRTEVHHKGHDSRNHGNRYADWRTCRHNHLDRHGNKTFCHNCGCEMVWKGHGRYAHYEVIPPRPTSTCHPGARAMTPPPPAKYHR